MKIGFFAIGLANLSRPEILGAAATAAEEAGISTLWTGEHIVFVEKMWDPLESTCRHASLSIL